MQRDVLIVLQSLSKEGRCQQIGSALPMTGVRKKRTEDESRESKQRTAA